MENIFAVWRWQKKPTNNMIDGLMNNVRKVKDKDKPRESVLAKLRLNQKKVAKQGKKQTQQKAMTEDMERKKK